MPDNKRRPSALKLSTEPVQDDVLRTVRTPRFAEHTTVISPIQARGTDPSPFADPEKGIAGTGFTHTNGPLSAPLKSAIRSPTAAPSLFSPTFSKSATFKEDEKLEKQEMYTEKEQARDLRIKARVRMAKLALRGVSFSCSLIILSMMSSTFAIFNATRSLPSQNNLPSWAESTKIWPQVLVLVMSCISLLTALVVLGAYCRGGHRRADKVNTYYTTFAIGWFILNMVLWAIAAGLFQHSRNSNGNKDMWGWSCVENKRSELFSEKVDYSLACRLQNWALICIIIEVVIEVVCVALYSIVFYRYYTKRRLWKAMNSRDKARSDLYLAQLRTQSVPNTPGLPKTPMTASMMSPRKPPASYYHGKRDIDSDDDDDSNNSPQERVSPASVSQFRLQPAPVTKKMALSSSPPTMVQKPAEEAQKQKGPSASNEPTYESVPIPGAY